MMRASQLSGGRRFRSNELNDSLQELGLGMLFVAFAISCAQSFYFCYERVERLTEGRMDEELPTGFGFVRPGHSVTSTGSPTSSRTFVPFVSSRAFLIRVPTSGLTRSGVREMSAERKLKNAAMTGSASASTGASPTTETSMVPGPMT